MGITLASSLASHRAEGAAEADLQRHHARHHGIVSLTGAWGGVWDADCLTGIEELWLFPCTLGTQQTTA